MIDDTRAGWSARPTTWTATQVAYYTVAPGARVGVSWHYPGGPAGLFGKPHTSCLARVNAWQRDHQAKDWADIGYNLLICPHARVIEGRGVDLVGAHSPGVNRVHYGVQLMAGVGETPTPAMFAKAAQLNAWLEARSRKQLRQWGHQDDPQASTACPGAVIQRWVDADGPNRTTTTPTPTPTPTQEDDDVTPEQVEATAQRAASLVWSRMITRTTGKTSAIQELADVKTIVTAQSQLVQQLVEQVAGDVARDAAILAAIEQLRASGTVDLDAIYGTASRAVVDVIGQRLDVDVIVGADLVAEPTQNDPHELPAPTPAG